MDDIEERPNKIRKIDPSSTSNVSSPDMPEATSPPSDTPHNPTTTTLDADADLPFKDEPPENDDQPKLSKSQLKKIRKKEAWEAGKDHRKHKRREKHKEKQARKATERQELSAKIASGEIASPIPAPHPKAPPRPIQVPIGLILDCDFNDFMTEKEIISLGAQLTRSYSENRSAGCRTHLVISSWGGRLKERFETVLDRNHESWKGIMFMEEGFVDAGRVLDEVMKGKAGGKIVGALKDIRSEGEAKPLTSTNGQSSSGNQGNDVEVPDEKPQMEGVEPTTTEIVNNEEKAKPNGTIPPDQSTAITLPPEPSLVYLSSDSSHTLTTLSPFTTYIIGGIVDKNRHKGLCYKRATELGIPTAKLPIGEYMTMNSRSVLAVNHVVEIMLRWLECGDWGAAFDKVIPKRKGGVLRSKAPAGEDGENENGKEAEEEEEEQDGDYYKVKNDEEQ